MFRQGKYYASRRLFIKITHPNDHDDITILFFTQLMEWVIA